MQKSKNACINKLKDSFLSSELEHRRLIECVLNQIDSDDDLFRYPFDYRDASAGVSGFIYYSETVEFAKKHILLILPVLNQFEADCGPLDKPIECETQYFNWLAWFALEYSINELISFLDD